MVEVSRAPTVKEAPPLMFYPDLKTRKRHLEILYNDSQRADMLQLNGSNGVFQNVKNVLCVFLLKDQVID